MYGRDFAWDWIMIQCNWYNCKILFSIRGFNICFKLDWIIVDYLIYMIAAYVAKFGVKWRFGYWSQNCQLEFYPKSKIVFSRINDLLMYQWRKFRSQNYYTKKLLDWLVIVIFKLVIVFGVKLNLEQIRIWNNCVLVKNEIKVHDIEVHIQNA